MMKTREVDLSCFFVLFCQCVNVGGTGAGVTMQNNYTPILNHMA